MKNMVKLAENFISKYVTMKEAYYTLPLALWAMHTYCWQSFDVTPYLVITKPVPRAGGTRLMEILFFISDNPQTFSPDSPAAMLRVISQTHPTCFLDEAEKFNAENHPARELLNKGYRRGQTIPKVINGEPMELSTYCPKAFVLIGDVYSTLRDRTITVMMRRRTPVEAANSPQFRMTDAKEEGKEIGEILKTEIDEKKFDIKAGYTSLPRLDFLNDRDEEVWGPLFVLCKIFCPDRIEELKRTAVDMAQEKQAEARKESRAATRQADNDEAGVLLLKDMLKLSEGKKYLPSSDTLEQLQALSTSPWRKFRGVGLTTTDMASLLEPMKIIPKPVRVSKKWREGQRSSVLRGYRREDLLAAAKLVGLV